MAKRIKWSMVHIPDDLGVFNVGGRTGARKGPEHFNFYLRKFRGKFDALAALDHEATFQKYTGNIEAHLAEATRLVTEAHEKTGLSVVVGGGHDHGYSHLLGLRKVVGDSLRLGCINLDAHLDVRKPEPIISSGSPFYLALTEKVIQAPHFVEFGIQSHCNGAPLWKFIEDHGVKVVHWNELRSENRAAVFRKTLDALSANVDQIAISLDLDCLAQAFAPGVSAPQAEGFSSDEMIAMMEIAGAHPKVVSLGIFELNPLFDVDGKTSRLAATCAFHFLEAKAGL